MTDSRIYLHLFDQPKDLALSIPKTVKSAKLHSSGKPVAFKSAGMNDYYIFDLSGVDFDPYDTVLELNY
jgi:hypothetical protein